MRFDVVTIFPELFEPFVRTSIVGRAVKAGLVEVRLHELREFSTNKHRTVDDYPFGGGAGMLMGPEPFFRVVEAIEAELAGTQPHHVLLTPAGAPLTQDRLKRLAKQPQVTLLCGHYKGIDSRVESVADEELSIGDYVLSGGEIPAMVLMDAAIRLLPGAVGTYESVEKDSHYEGLLDYPMYTRPASFRGLDVPDVLLSGHHAQIEAWRRARSEERTRTRRPDLWAKYLASGGHPPGSDEKKRKSSKTGIENSSDGAAAGGAEQEVEVDGFHPKVGTGRNGQEEEA